MNKGISITELAAQIEAIERGKRDLVVPSTKMRMQDGQRLVVGTNGDREEYRVSQLAHEQIGARLKIPREYYKRMQTEAPDLLDQNVNTCCMTMPDGQ